MHIFLIILFGVAVYSNTFNVPFQWDDKTFIAENPIVKDLKYFISPSKAKGFEFYEALRGRYMGYLTFAINYRLHGLDVKGYHVVNIALHILNSLLVYALLRLTLRTPFMSAAVKQIPPSPPLAKGDGGGFYANYLPLFVGLVFVSHPIQTEAVTYIMGRLPLLMWFFYLSSMVLYAKWRLDTEKDGVRGLWPQRGLGRSPKVLLYILSVLSAVLAMKTKENAFTLPVVLALYEFLFFEGRIGKRTLYLLPFLITLLIIPLGITGFDKPIGSAASGYQSMPRMDYFFTQFAVAVTYVRLLILPINQNIDYDYPVFHSFLNARVSLSFVFLLAIASLAVFLIYRSRRKDPGQRLVAFGILWFFITLSVESSIIPLPMMISEYRLYLPSVGILLAVTVWVAGLMAKIANRKTLWMVFIIIFLLPLVFSCATYKRNEVWGTEIALWKDAAMKSPNKARPHNNLAMAYAARGMTDKAVEHYRTALRVNPYYVETYVNLGNIYMAKGLRNEAEELFLRALKALPDFAEAYYSLGVIYGNEGLEDKAQYHFMRAVELKPDFAEAHSNLGTAYWHKGLYDRAIEHYRIAISLKPENSVVHFNLGKAYESKGLMDEAKMEFEKAKGPVAHSIGD